MNKIQFNIIRIISHDIPETCTQCGQLLAEDEGDICTDCCDENLADSFTFVCEKCGMSTHWKDGGSEADLCNSCWSERQHG